MSAMAKHSTAVQKHLAIMRATKARWQVADAQKAAASAEADAEQLEARVHDDVWLAAQAGSTACVRRFVERDSFDVFSHHDGVTVQVLDGERVRTEGGGMTALHYAAWGGHLGLARYLLSLVRRGLGAEKAAVLCNQVDSACSRSTPLILACRSAQGHLNERFELIQLLVAHGADAAAQDARGDTCLHHAVRARALSLVRFFVRGANNTVLACSTRNGKGVKPVELAVSLADKPGPAMATSLRIVELLRVAEEGGGLRRKIECAKRRRGTARHAARQAAAEEADYTLETAREMVQRATLLCRQQYIKAERSREIDEAAAVSVAESAAQKQMAAWLRTEEGQAKLELETYDIKTELKLERKARSLRMPRFRGVDAEAAKRAKAGLFEAAAVQKGSEAKRSFRAQRPPIKFVSVQLQQ